MDKRYDNVLSIKRVVKQHQETKEKLVT